MLRIACLALVSFFLIAPPGASSSEPPSDSPIGPGLSGFVFQVVGDAEEPIPDAEILILRPAPESEKADASESEESTGADEADADLFVTVLAAEDGTFETELPDDLATFFVVVRAPGYRTIFRRDVEVGTEPLDIELVDAAVLTGTIIEEESGDGIGDAKVVLLKDKLPTPKPPMAILQLLYPDADCDADGNWMIDGLEPGLYGIRAEAPGWRSHKENEIPLNPGEHRRVDVGLLPATAIVGTVRDVEGAVVPEARVWLEQESPPTRLRRGMRGPRPLLADTDEDGDFSLTDGYPGVPGTLRVSHPDFSDWTGDVPAGAAGESTRLDVVLVVGATLTGGVYDLGDEPLEGAVVMLDPIDEDVDPEHLARRRTYKFPRRRSVDVPYPGTSDAEGAFELVNVPAGEHTVLVYYGGKTHATENRIRVVSGQAIPEQWLRIELGEVMSGWVVDENGKPMEHVRVNATSMDRRRRRDRAFVVTDAKGRFEIFGLEGDTCYLNVGAKGYASYIEEDVSTTVRDIRITLVRVGGVAGRVTLRDGGTPGVVHLAYEQASREGTVYPNPGRGGEGSLETDHGAYYDDHVEPGRFNLVISAVGYLSETVEVTVRPGEVTEGVDVELHRGVALKGRVVAVDGTPVRSALIYSGGGMENELRFLRGDSGDAASDVDGLFRLEGLSPGSHTLRVLHGDYPQKTVDVDVVATGVTSVEIVLTRGGTVEGRVTDNKGEPVSGAKMSVARIGSTQRTKTDADGYYRIAGLVPGAGNLLLIIKRGDTTPIIRRATVRIVEAEVTRADFSTGGVVMRGRVLRGETPISDAMLSLTPRGLADGPTSRRWEAKSGDDGSYEIVGLEPGGHSVNISDYSHTGGVTVSATSHSEIDVPDTALFEHDFQFEDHLVRGIIVDGETHDPVKDAMVSALPEGAVWDADSIRQTSFGFTRSISDGSFRLALLDTGGYTVRISKPGYAPATSRVEVGEHPSEDLRFELRRGRLLSGHVVNELGKPVVRAVVSAQIADVREQSIPAQTDANGRFEFSVRPDVPLTLYVFSQRYAIAFVPVDSAAGQELPRITLEAGGSLEIQVAAEAPLLRHLRVVIRDRSGVDFAALPFNPLAGMEPRELRVTGRLLVRNLPAGSYEIIAISGDSIAAAPAVVSVGERTSVTLPF